MVLTLTVSIACVETSEVDRIIERIVNKQGPDLLKRSLVTFKFRDALFTMKRNDGRFSYERVFTDSTGTVHDVLTNSGVSRTINGQPFSLDSAKARSVTVDVNSVVYFASLPYPLADPGVVTRLLPPSTIDGELFNKIEVTFTPEEGGLDYDDRFIYWIDTETDDIRYMAYFYHTDGGGSRFRKAVNIRTVGGIQFADYQNFASVPDTVRISVDRFDEYYANGAVRVVSDVNMDSIVVSFKDEDVRFSR
ncbi:MAG: hypothetical protein HKN13_03860 [Rhodothermales bacterium]|nr:hypothetical protein [Rhodothermales bacterium]